MTNNPLLAKWEEIHGKKKEEPKPKIIDEVGSTPSQEVIEKLRKLQPDSKVISSVSTKPKPLISYDPQSGEDSFLQIAEKVKNKEARVTSVTLNRDSVGLFTTGKTTITFEVEVWDTP
jgi:nitrogenase subunit NifH